MITKIHFKKDIHTAHEDKVLYAMNNELKHEKDTALRYGFVANAIENGLLMNLKDINTDVLGSIVVSPNQKSHKDGISRDYYGIICHSHTEDILRTLAPDIIFEILNTGFSDKEVASLIMGSGLMGQINGANVMEILKAIDESKAKVALYTLEGAEAVLAMQMGMKRLDKKYTMSDNNVLELTEK